MARVKQHWSEIEDPHKRYLAYIKSQEWKEIAQLVLDRDHHHCCCCGRSEDQIVLNIHHNSYQHFGNEREHLDDLVTLCKVCYRAIHMVKANYCRFKKPKEKLS